MKEKLEKTLARKSREVNTTLSRVWAGTWWRVQHWAVLSPMVSFTTIRVELSVPALSSLETLGSKTCQRSCSQQWSLWSSVQQITKLIPGTPKPGSGDCSQKAPSFAVLPPAGCCPVLQCLARCGYYMKRSHCV